MAYGATQNTLNNDLNVSTIKHTVTGFCTEGKEILDLNFALSSMRNKSEDEIIKSFMRAYFEDKLRAVKWLFFSRDTRSGMEERRFFRIIIKHLAKEIPVAIKKIVPLIPRYGRWDDMWNLLTTSLKNDVVIHIANTLSDDLENMEKGKPVSLLAKWLPSLNASSMETRDLAKIVVSSLHITNKEYLKLLNILREYIKIVEPRVFDRGWTETEYPTVLNKENPTYINALLRYDKHRRREYFTNISKCGEKVNPETLFPHDIVAENEVDPYKALLKIINSERYQPIEDAVIDLL